MSDRTYTRDSHGPRVVDKSGSKTSTRKRRESDECKGGRCRHDHSKTTPRKEASGRRRTESSNQGPRLELRVLRQPQRVAALGMPVEVSVVVNLQSPNGVSNHDASCTDTTGLVGFVSLVEEQQRRPLEKSSLATQHSYVSNIQPLPVEAAQRLSSGQSQALGYMSFPGLVIRQSGDFRIRTSLLRMSADQCSTMTVGVVDSEPVRIERGRVVR